MQISQFFNSDNTMKLSGILVIILIGALCIYTEQGSEFLPLIAMASFAQLLCFVLFIRQANRAHNSLLRLFWAQAILIVGLYFLVKSSFVAILSIVWIVQATELYGPRRAAWLLLGSVSVLGLSQLSHWSHVDASGAIFGSVMYGLFQLFALSASQQAIRERKLREETTTLNAELISTRQLLHQTTAQSERVRIARDLHDILGHHMTALILNLEVARHLAEGNALEKVEQSMALAKLLLGDLRTTVSELREDDEIDLQQSITTLATNLPGLDIDIDFSKAPAIKDAKLAHTLLRCTQEAITNVLRHSGATRCRVAVAGVADTCILEITDNGEEKVEVVPGNGLRGMSERVKANAGSLSWQQKEGSFVLRVELPLGYPR